MDDVASQFLDAIHRLEDVRDAITPDRAHAEFDEITDHRLHIATHIADFGEL